MKKTVLPIRARQTGDLARTLEERGCGSSDFQLLIESPHEVVSLIDAIKASKLSLADEFMMPAIEEFRVANHVMQGYVDGIKLFHISDSFQEQFGLRSKPFGGKLEPAYPESTVRSFCVEKLLKDGLIFNIIGDDVAITSVSLLWELLKLQGHGEDGRLLVNGGRNVFYIVDQTDVLRSVHCYWAQDEKTWMLYSAAFNGSASAWQPGTRVFSH